MIANITEVYTYIRDEMEYAQRRWRETEHTWEEAYWETRHQTLWDMGLKIGMVNLPRLEE